MTDSYKHHELTLAEVMDLEYSTYLGGTDSETGVSIAIDGYGNAYITGETTSLTFPEKNAYQSICGGGDDAYITKLDPSGSLLVYSTYLGGSEYDGGKDIAVDNFGNAYVTGITQSSNFPTKDAFQGTHLAGFLENQVFLTKLDSSGSSLIYSTYFGGSDYSSGTCVTVDISGNAVIAGSTQNTSFPTINAFQGTYGGGYDGFITKFNPSGSSLLYSSYLGGSSHESIYGIAIDNSGSVFVTGYTISTNYPTRNAYQIIYGGGDADAYITKIDSSGTTLSYSTFLGGALSDSAHGVAVDNDGYAYVTGYTESRNFPTLNAYQVTYAGGWYDVFISKLNAPGSALMYSTYLGGNGDDRVDGVAVDNSGNTYVVGQTWSWNFPTKYAFIPVKSHAFAACDGFLTKLDYRGTSLSYSTYLAGSDGASIRDVVVDTSGNAYLTGNTGSTDFPVKNAFQPFLRGDSDTIVAKFNYTPLVPGLKTMNKLWLVLIPLIIFFMVLIIPRETR